MFWSTPLTRPHAPPVQIFILEKCIQRGDSCEPVSRLQIQIDSPSRGRNMSQFFQKPENALKRAHELVSMPNPSKEVVLRQKMSALEILYDALTSSK